MKGLRQALLALTISLILTSLWLDIDPGTLLDKAGLHNALQVLAGFTRPDTDGVALARIGALALESVAIGFAGTGLALVIGIVMAILAARLPQLPDAPGSSGTRSQLGRLIRAVVRGLLLLFRSIPEIVWAYLFVRIFGLGAGPAVFAIAITFSGILGKLYSEILESVDPEPILALRAAGAGRVGTLVYGALPQVRSEWMRYALFRLECGVRSGTVLGVVGAGGLGTEIDLAIRYLEYDTLATCLLVILLIVAAVEVGSGLLHRLHTLQVTAIGITLVALSLVSLDVPWVDLFSASARAELTGFASSFGNPNQAPAFSLQTMG